MTSAGQAYYDDLDHSEYDQVPDDEDFERPLGISADAVLDVLRESADWLDESPRISDNTVGWCPDLCSVDQSRVVYIHLVEELRPHMRKRLRMAVGIEKQVIVALALPSLFDSEVVKFLCELECDIVVIRDGDGISASEASHVLTTMSKLSIPVDLSTRTYIGHNALEGLSVGNSYEKGRKFERILDFLLSQVADFRVVERNYRGATDEIDLVIQFSSWSDRSWHAAGAPLAIVEAKNWARPVDQQAVRSLHGKVRDRNERVWLGFLFSAGKFTSAAVDQVLKYSTDQITIVLIDGTGIREWIESDKPDDHLEELVRHAVLL